MGIFFILVLILAPVLLACYNLIIIPQKIARNHIDFVCNKIKQGDMVDTFNGNTGTILHIFRNTVILELENGCKAEILKQLIKGIHTTKPVIFTSMPQEHHVQK
jgi:preprotein translocase YajC subunit